MPSTKRNPTPLLAGEGEVSGVTVSTDTTRRASLCLEPRYTKIPDRIALLKLTPREEQLIHRLLSHRWTPDARIYPSIKRLAELMDCTRRTVQRTLRRLEGRGLLVSEPCYQPVTGQTTNTYHLAGALLAIVTEAVDQVVARPVDDRRPPATSTAPERDSGNQRSSKGDWKPRQRSIPTDPAAYLTGRLGGYIRT